MYLEKKTFLSIKICRVTINRKRRLISDYICINKSQLILNTYKTINFFGTCYFILYIHHSYIKDVLKHNQANLYINNYYKNSKIY